MGDDLAENYFENEDVVEDLRAGGAYDSEAEVLDAVPVEISSIVEDVVDSTKSSKKKRKIEELKKKIANKKEKIEKDGAENSSSGSNRKSHSALTAADAYNIFSTNQVLSKESGKLVAPLEERDFTGVPDTREEKFPCPIVSSIASLIPDYQNALTQSSEEIGCPLVLVICGAGHRTNRVAGSIQTNLKLPVAKLFSKHIKVTEQVEMLSAKHYPIATGNPNRLSRLVELGALDLKNTQLIVIDAAEDEKNYNVMSNKPQNADFYNFMDTTVRKILPSADARSITKIVIAASDVRFNNNQKNNHYDGKKSKASWQKK